jgi:5-methylcytosine-specific restriction endonuclease McrA
MTITSVPKPDPTEKQARKPLRTLTPMKRGSSLSRKTPVKKVNRERQAEKDAEQRAWYASPEWERMRQATFARDHWTCQMKECGFTPVVVGMQPVRDILDSRYLVCHHKTNVRFGGKERPSDLITWCNQCHDRHHATQMLRPRGLRGGR